MSLTVITLSYPVWVYLGLRNGREGLLTALLAAIGLLHAYRAAMGNRASWLWVVVVLALLLWSLGWESNISFKLYPVAINLGMLAIFSFSLVYPPSAVERLARLSDPDFPESGVSYTRNVTIIWCIFFVCNGTISLWTVQQSEEVWALYNGFISYILIGLLFAGEWLFRQWYRRHHA